MTAVTHTNPLAMLVLDFREKVAFVPDEVPGFLLRARTALDNGDVFMLSTCNRTELYAVHPDLEGAAARVRDLLVEYKAVDPDHDAQKFYVYHGRGAVEQLFRVAAGVDSQALGEVQILQQVKDAYEVSLQANVLGVVGERLLAAAIRCGKRARAETAISAGAMSIGFAAVSLAHKVFGDFSSRTAVVLGAGKTGTLVAGHLREHGIGQLLIVNRTPEPAQRLAAELRGEAYALADLDRALAAADFVISSTASPTPLIDAGRVRQAMRARQQRTFLLVDIGVPRDVEPAVRTIENVFLHDVDGLQIMIQQTLVRRRREVPKVERIVSQEVQHYLDWYHGMRAAPVIKELRGHLELLRDQEMERQTSHMSPEQRAAVEQVTRALLNKLLHRPTHFLREASAQGESGLRRIEVARELFGLDESTRPDDHDPTDDSHGAR
jgi:glutamyl-tRNA reductase